MVSRSQIKAFVDQIVARFRPHKIILFGSHAWGHATVDSDVDLLVVMQHRESGPATAGRIRIACPRDFPLDLIVRTPAELRQRVRMGDYFFREITAKGIVLHESGNA